jgi:Uncharacterized protein conserved in bacteria (DUF2188)
MARADVRSDQTGEWRVLVAGETDSAPYKRQRDAEVAARRLVSAQGGGEVIIHTRTGRLTDVQTVPSSEKLPNSAGSRQSDQGRPNRRGLIARLKRAQL